MSINSQELKDIVPLMGKKRDSDWELDLNELYAPNGKYTPEEKLYAVVCYMVEGNSIKASKRCGVPPDTIRWWKNESSWWNDAMREARRQYQDMLDARLTSIIHKATDEFEDRLINGDEVITKGGGLAKKKMGGRDVATSMAILYDKRALLRGDPTSNPGKGSSNQLDALAQKFEAFARKMEESGNLAKPIQGKVVSADEILNQGE